MRAARAIAIGVVVCALGGFAWATITAGRHTEPTDAFCIAYRTVDDDLADVDRVLSRQGQAGDGSLETLRGVIPFVWSDTVAEGGPPETDEDAVAIATAVRAAVRADDPAPIRTQEVGDAAERVAAKAAAACAGSEV